jgi:hypothetical protein
MSIKKRFWKLSFWGLPILIMDNGLDSCLQDFRENFSFLQIPRKKEGEVVDWLE